jgi:ABC-type polysaccharide/polyol phosphate export permease
VILKNKLIDSEVSVRTIKQVNFIEFFQNTIHELIHYRYALYNFVVNTIKIRYRRSKLGFLWTLLNPLLTMGVISVVFSMVFKQDIRVFSIFLFSGLTPWTFISNSIVGGTSSIVTGESYLKKIYVPKVLFPIITVSVEAVNFILSATALYLLSLVIGGTVTWSILLLPFALVLMYIFSLGITLLLSVTFVYFRDISHVVQVAFTALFYLTPIIYPADQIPEQLRQVFLLNPFSHYIFLCRKIILGTPMTWSDWIIPLVIGLFVLFLGFVLIFKKDKDIIFRL